MKTRIALLAALVAAFGTSCAHAPRSINEYRAELFRDTQGIAHVYARTEEDGFYGVGYALAEDRLAQVLTWYVAVRGELAKTFGKETPAPPGQPVSYLADAVASDTAALKYRYLEVARENLSRLPPQYQRNLRAYVDGIQAYLAQHPDKAPAWAPPLEPALPLAVFHFFVQEARQVCPARRRFEGTAKPVAWVPDITGFDGSNAWAAGRMRTADGGVFFSADSHGPIQAHGTIFYPYRIKAGALDFMAFEPMGTATFLFGHSDRFAWGATEGPRFVADCYRVKLRAGDPQSYDYDGKPQLIERVPYRIEVRDAPAVTGIFEYTRHNGVRSPVEERTEDAVYVVSYAQAERMGLGSGDYYRMAKARTRAEFEAAVATGDLYPANLVAAGADGSLLLVRPGAVPVRPNGLDVRGTLDGNTSATAWRGLHPYAERLKLVDPAAGYLSNTNNSPEMTYAQPPLRPADYPTYYAFEAGRTNERQRRLLEILGSNAPLTQAQAIAAVMDETLPMARPWGAKLRQALGASAVPGDVERACVQRLAEFDSDFRHESSAALAFIELQRRLRANRELFARLNAEVLADGPLPATSQGELLDAARQACAALTQRHGRSDLTLGDVYRVGRGDVDLPIGSGQVPGGSTVRGLQFAPADAKGRQRLTGGVRSPFLVHYGTHGVRTFAQTPYGVSDDPASPHYADQARLASEKRLQEVPLTRDALIRSGATRVELR